MNQNKSASYHVSGGAFLCDYRLGHQKTTAPKHYADCVQKFYDEKRIIEGEMARINAQLTLFNAKQE